VEHDIFGLRTINQSIKTNLCSAMRRKQIRDYLLHTLLAIVFVVVNLPFIIFFKCFFEF